MVNYMIFMRFLSILYLFALFFGAVTPSFALDEDLRPAPEIATGTSSVSTARGGKIMAVTAHPEATKVAYDVLKRGGTAVDAAIAAQLVLGLVEPQSSGIGGGAFALYYDAEHHQIFSFDGREIAPQTAGEYLFVDSDGKGMNFYDAAIGGRSVGVPGVPKMLEMMHRMYGDLSWRELFYPAIELAERGVKVTPRLNKMLASHNRKFNVDVKTKLNFFPDSKNPLRVGSIYKNPAYAKTLRLIATKGSDAFYKGEMAQDIVKKVREIKSNPGALTLEDMASYKAKMRDVICDTYRGYKICSMGQPSSGGITLLQILKILENFNLKALGADNPKSWHIISEASRLAFADRNKYIADSDFTGDVSKALLNGSYIKNRSRLINMDRAMLEVSAGDPPVSQNHASLGLDSSPKPPGTTHMSIVDMSGNIVSMTSSIESAFGSHLMVDGFLLNNQLTDFAFVPTDSDGNKKANRVEGGKRPRSSMAPTIVFDPSGQPFMVLGSAGGSRIIGFVLQQIISVIDWGMPIDVAIAKPHIVHRGKKLELETSGVDMAEDLKNHGHAVLVGEMNSGLSVIKFNGRSMIGVADPRREGLAIGE